VAEPIISVKDLRLTPDPGAEPFSLEVEPGQKVIVCGPSGCGKSTLLRAIVGLGPQRGGAIAVDGRPLDAHTVWEVRRMVAFVVQEPDLGRGTAEDVLRRPFGFRANAHLRFDRDTAADLLRRFGLTTEVLVQEIGKLSGGEKQRVALVSAILLQRPVYLLDEPTSALDRGNAGRVVEFFRTLDGATVLLATHERDEYSHWDRIVPLPAARPRNEEDWP